MQRVAVVGCGGAGKSNYHRDSRPRLDAALARHCDHLEVIELTSRRSVASFLAHIPAKDGQASRGQ